MHRVGLLVYPGCSVMGLAPIAVFETANLTAKENFYDIRLLSEHGGLVNTAMGVGLETAPLDGAELDTLMISGTTQVSPTAPGLIAAMQAAAPRLRRISGICTGAFALAEAGFLDGRRATTHWLYTRELGTRFPKVKVDEDRIFIQDGNVWTSAGMSAGIDLALALVEQDMGGEAARTVAKKMVVYHRRAGGQSQFSALLELEPKSDRIQQALVYARNNLQAPLSVAELAEAARLSPRQFSRAFHAETGQSPAKAVENLRLEAARILMEQGRHSIEAVAQQTGFSDPDRMRRAFLRAFGQPPQVIRRNARAAA
ncbi:GlxA family transcriptional regulator [Aquabacter sp. CN5-332]|uniref:GlxA family transcriptional regulator n=1 Tax=Aquabacter sp. CN5-332 TaxID=3156608 RepID=UPI0032B5B7BD